MSLNDPRQTAIPGADERPNVGPAGVAAPARRGPGRPKGSGKKAPAEPEAPPARKRPPRVRKPRGGAAAQGAAPRANPDDDRDLLGELEPGVVIHASRSTVDNTPRWSHSLFPWDEKTAEEMAKYDRIDARFGRPEVIKLQRRHPATKDVVSIPHEYAPHELDEEKIQRLYGGGHYFVRAFATYATADSQFARQVTRGRWIKLDGPSKPIRIDAGQDDAPPASALELDELDEPEEEEEDEIEHVSEAVALKRLELEAAAAAEERRAARKREEREEQEERERREELRREERERREDRRDRLAREERQAHELRMANLRAPASQPDPLTAIAHKIMLEKLPAALTDGDGKQQIVQDLIGMGTEAIPGLLALVQQIVAAKAGQPVIEPQRPPREEEPADGTPEPAAIEG